MSYRIQGRISIYPHIHLFRQERRGSRGEREKLKAEKEISERRRKDGTIWRRQEDKENGWW